MLSNVLKSIVLLSILLNFVNSDLCLTDRVDNAYTKMMYHRPGSGWYSEITIIENGNQYVLNTRSDRIGKPIKENTDERILTRAQILDHQQSNCSEEELNCKEMKKIINKSIVFVSHPGGYMYMYLKVEDDNDKELNQYELPWNQSDIGDPIKYSKFNLWPNEWITQSHPCVAYDYWSKELIYIMNENKGKTQNTKQLFRVALNPDNYPFTNNRSVDFTQQTLNSSQQFVGLFNYANGTGVRKIFAITRDQRLFELKESNAFEESALDFKHLIRCVIKDESHNWTLLIIIVVVTGLVILFIVILLAFVYKRVFVPNYYRQRTSTKTKTKGEEPTTRSTGTRASDRQTELVSIVTINSTTGKPLTKEERVLKQNS